MRTILIGLLCASAWGQSPVVVTGPLKMANADGWTGDLTVSWPSMKCGTTPVVKGSKTFRVTNGVVPTIQVYPTASCGNNRYTVNYTGGTIAYWTIPTTPSSQSITSIETLTAPALPVIPPFAIGQVSGLQAALDSLALLIPGSAVPSVFGRTGPITAEVGDYSAYYSLLAHTHTGVYSPVSHTHSGVYEPVDATIVRSGGSYSDPTWITGLAWSKITGTEAIMGITTGVGAPVSTPVKVGDVYSDLDSDPHVTYIADCTTTAGCWRSIGSGGSGTTTANYLQSFTSQTSVALTHSAGTDGIVAQCFDGSGQEIGYNTLVKTSTSTATVTFSVAQTGACVVNSSGGGGGGGGGGDTTAVSNSGAGVAMLKTGTNVTAKTLVAGANVTITPATDTITIAASGGGGGGSITIDGSLRTNGDGTTGVNGAVVPMFIAGTSSLTYTAIGNGACGVQTFTLSGALNGDSIAPGWPATMPAGFSGVMFVSAADTITVRLCNHSGGSVTPTAGLTYKAMIVRAF